MTFLEAIRVSVESVKSWAEGKFMNKIDGTPKVTYITILKSAWTGSDGLYYQTVVCNGVTDNSKLDLQPTPEQIVELQDDEVALMAVNNNGRAVVYAFNNTPKTDMVIQVEITEVSVV